MFGRHCYELVIGLPFHTTYVDKMAVGPMFFEQRKWTKKVHLIKVVS